MRRNRCGVAAALLAVGLCACGTKSSSAVFKSPERKIKVTAMDTYTYAPETITVKQGTIVHFTVKNKGKVRHEFVVGDRALQDLHEVQMQEMCAAMAANAICDMDMPDDAHGMDLRAGESKTFTWIAATPGEFEYACHEPGHYDHGMVGHLTVEA